MKKKILFLIGATALVASMIFSINFSIIADTGNFTLSSIVQMASADGEGGGSGGAECCWDHDNWDCVIHFSCGDIIYPNSFYNKRACN